MRKYLHSTAIVLSFAFSACSFAPQFQRPQMAVPAGWSDVANVGTGAETDALPFWKALGSDELDRLIDLALAQNLDLEAALHRIEQARALAKVAAAPLYPSVNAS